jgi:hypothetical protein
MKGVVGNKTHLRKQSEIEAQPSSPYALEL